MKRPRVDSGARECFLTHGPVRALADHRGGVAVCFVHCQSWTSRRRSGSTSCVPAASAASVVGTDDRLIVNWRVVWFAATSVTVTNPVYVP